MKTIRNHHRSGVPGLIKGLVLSLGLAMTMTSASAVAAEAGQVTVKLVNKVFGHRKSISVDSGGKTIFASESYDYVVKARCKGEKGTPISKVIPSKTPLAVLIESIAPGGSQYLKGSVSNPGGELPFTLLNKKFSGKKRIKGYGKVKIAFRVVAKVTEEGVCEIKVKNVKVKSSKGVNLGTIKFMKGSKVNFSVKPVITFERKDKPVNESKGPLEIPVWRNQNFRGAYSVDYATAPGTATSADFTPTSGTIDFAHGEVKKLITVPIIDNTIDDGKRSFSIILSNPTGGAHLGPIPTVRIDINDND